MTFIEYGFQFAKPCALELVPCGGYLRRKGAVALGQLKFPSVSFAVEFNENGLRNRIGEAEGDEVTSTRKPPVWQMAGVVGEVIRRNGTRRIKADKVSWQRYLGWNRPRHAGS